MSPAPTRLATPGSVPVSASAALSARAAAAIIFLALGFVSALAGLPTAQALSQPGDEYVVEVHHDPFSPLPDQLFNMSLTLKPELEPDWVKVFVCSITEGFCGAPVPAEPLAGRNHTYGNVSFIESKEGHTLGYKFLIKTTNETYYKFPSENTSYPGLEIVELMETPYFKVQIQGNYTPPAPEKAEDEGLTGLLAAPGAVGTSLTLLAATYMTRRRQ